MSKKKQTKPSTYRQNTKNYTNIGRDNYIEKDDIGEDSKSLSP